MLQPVPVIAGGISLGRLTWNKGFSGMGPSSAKSRSVQVKSRWLATMSLGEGPAYKITFTQVQSGLLVTEYKREFFMGEGSHQREA